MKQSFLVRLSCLIAVCLVSQTVWAKAETKSRHKARVSQEIAREIEDWAGSVSELRPNALSFEALGRGLLYGVNYDRSLNESWALGIGYSQADIKTISARIGWQVIPLYVNYYFLPDRHRPFITGSIHFVSIDAEFYDPAIARHEVAGGYEVTPSSRRGSGAFGGVGAGYEFRAAGGFLFRAALYEFIDRASALTWFGLSLGGTF